MLAHDSPTLLQVMGAAGAAHQRLRARAMATAHSLLTMLSNCVGAGVAGAAELLDQVLPPLLEACLAVLGEAAGEGGATHGVQLHTLKTVSMLLQAFPKRMSEALGALLPAVMALLASGLAAFEAREVRGAAAGGTAADEAYDSDGTPVGYEDCVAQLVEQVACAVVARAAVDMERVLPTQQRKADWLSRHIVGHHRLVGDRPSSRARRRRGGRRCTGLV